MSSYVTNLLVVVVVVATLLLPGSLGLLLSTTGHSRNAAHYPGGVAAFTTKSSSIAGRYGGSHYHSSALFSSTQTTPPPFDLLPELESKGLGLCHGILYASGVRRLSDVKALTDLQIDTMGVDSFDRSALRRVMNDLNGEDSGATTTTEQPMNEQQELSTVVDGAFDQKKTGRFEPNVLQDFQLESISEEHDIFKGRLFTKEQCLQMSRMAEYHAYCGTGTIGAGWTNELYTLTAQHMQCKEVPGFLSTTRPIFDQLRREMYDLFPGRIRHGSIVYESDGEPHLVKYHGKAKGTQMHTDNSEYIYITLNVVLSANENFSGGC